MPLGKRQQTNAMLYTVVTFVGLFIIAASVAVIFYLKFEDQRKIAETAQADYEKMVSSAEQREGLGKIIGTIPRRKSGLGLMVEYLDKMTQTIIGGIAEDTSAEVKIDTVNTKVNQTLELLAQGNSGVTPDDPNTGGLTRVIEKMKSKNDELTAAMLAANDQLDQLRTRFDDAMATSFEKEKVLLNEKEKYQQQVNEIRTNYNELKVLMEQTTEQQVQIILTQLERNRVNSKKLNQQLLKTQAELKVTQDRVAYIQEKLQAIVPPPDSEITAFRPDGKIILLDERERIVSLNIGSNDRVYRGLTFSVYDKNVPIPRDGKGKAEIEVFNVTENISTAKIVRSEKRKPILLNDIIANLIWDSEKINVFVVAGDFDLDGDGRVDSEAAYKIKILIEKWGAKVSDNVSIDTDFVVLGKAPRALRKPTFEQLEIYPGAMEKYDASLQKLNHYKGVQSLSQTLSVPIFNTERFLDFIGYSKRSGQAGAF